MDVAHCRNLHENDIVRKRNEAETPTNIAKQHCAESCGFSNISYLVCTLFLIFLGNANK